MNIQWIRRIVSVPQGIPAWGFKALLVCLVICGLLLRLRHLLLNRSLWLDEAFLSIAIVERPITTLLSLPLPYEQTPPPLFLIITKLWTNAVGVSETALRFFPFITSSLTLCLFPLFLKKHSQTCVLIGTFLLAFSFGGIYYAAEFKPYACEAFFTVIFLLIAIEYLKNKNHSHFIVYCIVFILAPFFDFTTVFLLIGVGTGIAYHQAVIQKKLSNSPWALLLLGFLSLGIMLVWYALPASKTQLRMEYWNTFKAPVSISVETILWYGRRATLVVCHFFGLQEFWQGVLFLYIAISGFFALMRRDISYGLMCTVPIVSVVIFSMFGKFPLHERLLIFLLPIICLSIAEGIQELTSALTKLSPAIQWLPAFVLIIIMAHPILRSIYDNTFFERQEFKKISQLVLQRCTGDDVIFVLQAAVPIWRYYRQQDKRIAQFIPLSIARGDQASLAAAIQQIKSAGHGWVIAAHVPRDEEHLIQENVSCPNDAGQHVTVKGAWAFTFGKVHCTTANDDIHAHSTKQH